MHESSMREDCTQHLSETHVHRVDDERSRTHLQIPDAVRMIESRMNFENSLQISRVPDVQAVIIIHTRQPAVHRVIGHGHRVWILNIQIPERHRRNQL